MGGTADQHQSEISVLNVADWQYIFGEMTVSETPLPTTLPLFATGLGAIGLLGWRRKRKAQAAC
jgi:hypothetical protein